MLGALTMAAPEPDAFDEHEVALLAELADDLAYGIANLRTRVLAQDAQATIARLAYYDALTGLPNRAQLVERLQAAMDNARLHNRPLALMHLEIGRFHEINKVLGYSAGDELVLALARRLLQEVQDTETLARVGETEFGLLLPDGGAEYAVQVAQRLAGTLHEPVNVSGLIVDPRMVVGIALFPGHASDADALIRRANAAMHQVTPARGGYAMYAGGQEQENTRRLALMGDLHRAIRNNELQLYCQPKVDIATRRVHSAEALVRWQHPVQGLVSTSEFILLAEHAGTITPLTNWMLEAAFGQCHAWQAAGLDQALAINLSAQDLYDLGLIDRIRDLFSTWGIGPERIQFELTESSLMADPAGALETLTRLKRLGVQLFIDDYGTGYSSLSYLQKLPVDAIKIDQSFVMPMADGGDSAAIVSSTIELGHKLGLQVVAEGVETQAVWDQLAALGCDVAQGYLISRPMPAKQFKEWVRNW
jgi:diguanylate cyclase (GGDEF)-like protein